VTIKLFVAALVAASAVVAGAIEYKRVTPQEIDELRARVLTMGDATSTDEQDHIKIKVPSKSSFYYFTKSNHAGHPAVVMQRIFEERGSLWIKSEGLTAGDASEFERWLKLFELQQRIIQEEMRKR